MNKPVLVEYFDTSFEEYVQEYLVKETEESCFFVSHTTHTFARKLNKEELLFDVSTKSLPKNWVTYSLKPYKEYNENFLPKIFKENENEILELINSEFYYISRICSFLEEYSEFRCERDFMRQCVIGWAITEKHLPEELMLKLFSIVFRTYPKLYERDKLKLLVDKRIGSLMVECN